MVWVFLSTQQAHRRRMADSWTSCGRTWARGRKGRGRKWE